ncbi:MAG: hypothetical protein ABSE80_14720, partial [Halobacteriota archaeon]
CRRFDIMASVSEQPAQVRYLRSLTTQRNAITLLLTGEETQSNRTTFKNQDRAKRMLEGK